MYFKVLSRNSLQETDESHLDISSGIRTRQLLKGLACCFSRCGLSRSPCLTTVNEEGNREQRLADFAHDSQLQSLRCGYEDLGL